MELLCKLLKQIAPNTRPKIENHMLIVMDKSTHEELISQTLQTNKRQFEIENDDLTQIDISPGAYEIESLDNEIKRINIEEGHLAEDTYPYKTRRFSVN